MIEAGRLNRRLTIWQATAVQDSTGDTVSSWSEVATIWAGRQALGLRDVTRMAGVAEGAEAKFVIRWRTDVTTRNEVSCDGRRYGVVAVDEVGDREGLALLVRAV